MSTLLPRLDGRHVRLEPLQQRHAAGLAEAAAGDPSLYQLSPVPQGEAAAAEYIEAALAQRDAGTAAPFAVLRRADGAVIGSTRFWDLVWWPWPQTIGLVASTEIRSRRIFSPSSAPTRKKS